jgi:serine/threonine-protein kinase RsbT
VPEALASTLPISGEPDIIRCRQRAREAAAALGFRNIDQSRITTAVSELTRNVVRYATDGRGRMELREVRDESGGVGIEIVVSDEGPGIKDVEHVLEEGYMSKHGMGLGLRGTRRLMDEMEITSEPGKGTKVTVRKWLR